MPGGSGYMRVSLCLPPVQHLRMSIPPREIHLIDCLGKRELGDLLPKGTEALSVIAIRISMLMISGCPGTEILAAREGIVTRVEDNHDGIGPLSNYVRIDQPDGTAAMYAHIRKEGATVKLGERVRQGQLVGYSGMVGQTLYPHVHFVVVGPHDEPVPVTFSDVEGGVPLAGHFYVSGSLGR
jgi:Peptidase family M23